MAMAIWLQAIWLWLKEKKRAGGGKKEENNHGFLVTCGLLGTFLLLTSI